MENDDKQQPRQLSTQEAQNRLARSFCGQCEYWKTVSSTSDGPKSTAERIDGVGYSMLALMDGNSGAMGGMAIANKSVVDASGKSSAARLDPELLSAMARVCGQEGLVERAIEFGSARGRLELIAERDPCSHVEMFEFMGRLRAAAIRWTAWAGGDEHLWRQACDGFLMSACALIEGRCEGFEGLALAAITNNGYDEESLCQAGQNWMPPLAEEDPLMQGDLGGDWRYAWSRIWGEESPNARILQGMMAAEEQALELAAAVIEDKSAQQHAAPRI